LITERVSQGTDLPLKHTRNEPICDTHLELYISFVRQENSATHLWGIDEGRMLSHSNHPRFNQVQIYCIDWHTGKLQSWGTPSAPQRCVFLVQLSPPGMMGHFALLFKTPKGDDIEVFHEGRWDLDYARTVAAAMKKTQIAIPEPITPDSDAEILQEWPGQKR